MENGNSGVFFFHLLVTITRLLRFMTLNPIYVAAVKRLKRLLNQCVTTIEVVRRSCSHRSI